MSIIFYPLVDFFWAYIHTGSITYAYVEINGYVITVYTKLGWWSEFTPN
jgi:hypothetical protein